MSSVWQPPAGIEQAGAKLTVPPKYDMSTWTVIDDRPDPVPVTDAEIAVFEQWFGDFFQGLFGPGG